MEPGSGGTRCPSTSEAFATEVEALAWIGVIRQLFRDGVNRTSATMTLTDYGESVMPLAMWDLEAKTLDPTSPGWRRRVVPVLGHLAVRMINNGRRFCHAIREPLSRRGATSPSSPPARTPGSERCPAAEFADINFDSRLWTVRPNFAVSLAASWTKEPRATSRFGPLIVEIRDVVRRRVENVGGNRIPVTRRAAWRPNCNRRIARCYALG